ncbi:hypothetical protein HDV05_005723 [Chytridiales sp. JEL 0842]|nr:hypothetical protein HDV05_005723 [Chytridiales sp. JEL 0842]
MALSHKRSAQSIQSPSPAEGVNIVVEPWRTEARSARRLNNFELTSTTNSGGAAAAEAREGKRVVVFALDGSTNALHALKWGLSTLKPPTPNAAQSTDHLILLSCGLIDSDVADVLQNVIDSLLSPILAKTDKLSTAKERIALQQSLNVLLDAESCLKSTLFPPKKKVEGDSENVKLEPLKRTLPLSYELVGLASEDPQSAIVQFVNNYSKTPEANGNSVDLLVMGSRGLGKVQRMLLGSTSDYCLTHVNCPTAVIPETTKWN